MTSRVFRDRAGCEWRVWQTVPTTARGVSAAYADGWLTFESAAQRRRLTPIPPRWELASAAELEALCLTATEVPRLASLLTMIDGAAEPSAREDARGDHRP